MHGLVGTPPSTVKSGLISTNTLNNSWKVKNILEKLLLWFSKEIFKASNLLCYLQLYNFNPLQVNPTVKSVSECPWSSLKLRDEREKLSVSPAWSKNTQVSSKQAGWGVEEQPGLENWAWQGMWHSGKVCDRQLKINLQGFQDLQINLSWRCVFEKRWIK